MLAVDSHLRRAGFVHDSLAGTSLLTQAACTYVRTYVQLLLLFNNGLVLVLVVAVAVAVFVFVLAGILHLVVAVLACSC